MTKRRHPGDSVVGTTYLIHLSEPLGDPARPRMHARHYIGWTNGVSIEQRLAEHRAGTGARILAAAVKRGIEFDVVHTWPNTDRHFERRLKNGGHFDRHCPICKQTKGATDGSS